MQKSWVYLSSCYSDAVRPASQLTCCIVECDATDLPLKKLTEEVSTKVKHIILVGSAIWGGLKCWSSGFVRVFCAVIAHTGKKQNTSEIPWAGYFIPGWIFLWLLGQKFTSALGFVAPICICSLPVSYLSAAFLCGVFYSTWTTRKVCTKLNLLNLVNNLLCVDAVMYFWGRKKKTLRALCPLQKHL